MSEQIRIPKQRSASRSKEENQQSIPDEEVYAAQLHHRNIDADADKVLDEIEDLVAEIEEGQRLRLLALGEIAVAA